MKCPGQDSRYWKPGAIFEAKCPKCDKPVEFFKDDPTRRCGHCGHKFVNPNMDFGCAAYCRFADECIGELPPELLAERRELMKDRIAVEMKKYFRQDFKRIGRATRVARHADALSDEAGGDKAIILAAAYLHDTGNRKANSNGGPPAREIMEKAGAQDPMIEEVCGIVSRRNHPDDEESINVKIVHDAIVLAEIEEAGKEKNIDLEQHKKIMETRLFTEIAKKRAEKMFNRAMNQET